MFEKERNSLLGNSSFGKNRSHGHSRQEQLNISPCEMLQPEKLSYLMYKWAKD